MFLKAKAQQSVKTHRFAVVLLHFSTLHGFGAAITSIITTVFVVVLVVAIAVSLVLRQRAGRLAALILWVDALAL